VPQDDGDSPQEKQLAVVSLSVSAAGALALSYGAHLGVDAALPVWAQAPSAALGWSYVLAWSLSFYPQVCVAVADVQAASQRECSTRAAATPTAAHPVPQQRVAAAPCTACTRSRAAGPVCRTHAACCHSAATASAHVYVCTPFDKRLP
jgi:hypothetical protein